MNDFDEKLRQLAAKEKIETPESVRAKMEQTLMELPKKEKKVIPLFPRIAAAAACFALVFLFILPNVSVAYATAMENIPIIGELIHVFTIRNYLYSDPYHQMDIQVPNVSDPADGEAADVINSEVDQLTQDLVQQFYDELEVVGDEGHGSVYVTYDVLNNTERWFVLKLSVHLISGSGDNYFVYYNVDRQTGKIVNLGDLFTTDDFETVLTENIKEQMRQRMKQDSNLVYWLDRKEDFGIEFAAVDGEHNYYFNEDGDLVIPFDKYEVGPGSMGCPEFVIEKDVYMNMLKEQYRNLMPK